MGLRLLFLAGFLVAGAAAAQQPTQEQAIGQRILLETEIAELRNVLTPQARAENAFAWATDQIVLGNKLRKLGEFEAETSHLEEAVTAYQAALSGIPCDKFATICGGINVSLEDVTRLIKLRGKK